MFDLILGKATLHELGVVLDFKEKTIQIDKILLPIASPMGLQYPNKAHRRHPHIMGDVACAWFGHPTCGGRVIGFSTHIIKC